MIITGIQSHFSNRPFLPPALKLLLSLGCLLGWLGGNEAFASTNFTKLIAWGQSASWYVPSPPGNSLPFIDHCFDLGYEGMELDVEISQDNIPILAHDLHLLNGDGSNPNDFTIADPTDYTFAELQQYNLGNWLGQPVRIPTFEAALRTYSNRSSILIMDMRVAGTDAPAISNAVRNAEFDQRFLAASAYDLNSGKLFKQALPQTRIYHKIYANAEAIPLAAVDAIEAAGLDGLMIQQATDYVAIKHLADYLHRKGLKLVLFVHYAFNTLPELQSLVDTQADYILTVHHEMYDQIVWPSLPPTPPTLKADFSSAEQKLTLTWQPQLPYSHRVQTSTDGNNWSDVRALITDGPETNLVQCTVAATGDCGFYRLYYTP